MLRWWHQMYQRAFLVLLLAACCPAAQPPAVFSQLDQMITTLGEITGWQAKKRIPSEVLTKEKFQRYLASHIKDGEHDKTVHAEEVALKMFGLVPPDFNLARETSDLLGEQAAAFYDYRKKRLYLLDSTPPGEEQQMALVHELAHALADQQHSLGKYLTRGSPDADETTAREAVMEGQATWLTWAFEVKRSGGKAEVPEGMIDRLTRERDDPSDFPVLENTPLYMRESLLFPYNAGARFQDAVYRKMGREAFNAVFARGPLSTQQVLHPSEYFHGKKPLALDLPGLDKILGKQANQYRGIIEGSVGEFDHAILLRQYIGELQGKDAAEHWRSGWFRLHERRKDQRALLTYASEWDSPTAARRYFELYQRVLKGKWKKMEVTSASETEVSGIGDSGRFILRLAGTTVQSFEGLP